MKSGVGKTRNGSEENSSVVITAMKSEEVESLD